MVNWIQYLPWFLTNNSSTLDKTETTTKLKSVQLYLRGCRWNNSVINHSIEPRSFNSLGKVKWIMLPFKWWFVGSLVHKLIITLSFEWWITDPLPVLLLTAKVCTFFNATLKGQGKNVVKFVTKHVSLLNKQLYYMRLTFITSNFQ